METEHAQLGTDARLRAHRTARGTTAHTLSPPRRHALARAQTCVPVANMMDLYSHIIPTYDIEPLEKITDAYLDSYL